MLNSVTYNSMLTIMLPQKVHVMNRDPVLSSSMDTVRAARFSPHHHYTYSKEERSSVPHSSGVYLPIHFRTFHPGVIQNYPSRMRG